MTVAARLASALRELFGLVSEDFTLTSGIGASVLCVYLTRALAGATWASVLLLTLLTLVLLENVWRSSRRR